MKRIFTLLVVMMITSVAFSQNFGVKGGFDAWSVHVKLSGESDSENVNGFYLGLFTEFDLSDMVNLQPELQYVYLTKDGENTSFLNLPLMFGYKVADNFTIQAGPQLGYNLEDAVDDYTHFELGLGAGAKLMFNENIFADARYNFGLTNHYTGTGSDELKVKYNSFQIGLGYKF